MIESEVPTPPMPKLELFFDCGSPWTYLAFVQIQEVAKVAGADLVWRPILVGGVFNSVNASVYEQRANPVPSKLRYYGKDLKDWARHVGIEIGSPSVFPVNSVKAMRGCFVALEAGCLPEYALAVFEAYWGRLLDISQDEVLRDVARSVGLDDAAFFERIALPETKQLLRTTTEELIERGGFGSPTMFVDDADMYFGNDRLLLVREALERASS